MASTYYDIKSQSLIKNNLVQGFGKTPLNKADMKVFNGTDLTRSNGKTIDLIGLSNERFKTEGYIPVWSDPLKGGDGKWHGKRALDKYELAETIYHEIFAHILLPTAGGYAKSKKKADLDHDQYGSDHTGLDPNGYSPHNMISKQLLILRSEELYGVEVFADFDRNTNSKSVDEICPAYDSSGSEKGDR